MKKEGESFILAGDIGGTKTSLGVFTGTGRPGPPLLHRKFLNAGAECLADLLKDFLAEAGVRPGAACFGVAGPVVDNRARMTNLNWFIDGRELADDFGFSRVSLVNDLVATAMGAVHLPESDLEILNPGRPDAEGNLAVIAPGTGLGEAFILKKDGLFLPQATEGGHSSFAPRNDLQIELLRFLLAGQDHVSVEQVCSGLGLPVIYDFMSRHWSPSERPREEMLSAADKTKVIIRAANAARGQGEAETAVKTVNLFVDILADEAANLALKTLATGGIYLGGGIPPRILSFLGRGQFLKTFQRGIYRQMLGDIPIRVILNPDTALLGAAALAQRLFP